MIRRKVEILKKAITTCMDAGKLLTQSELAGALDMSMTKLRSALGTADTADRLLRSYISCDKDGNITDQKLKKDIDNIGIDHYVQECSRLTTENKNLRKTVDDLTDRAQLS